MIKFIAIVIIFNVFSAQECDDGFVSIQENCYYENDIDVLDMFIENSAGSINLILDANNNSQIEPLELCIQEWESGRIILFDCNPIIINGEYNWINISGEIPYNITNWDNIEVLLLPYNDLQGYIPDDICDLNLDFSDYNVFNLDSNSLCPAFPECVENYVGSQSNWGTGFCELSNCYDVGVSEFAAIEINGDNLLNPIEDPYGIGLILASIYNDGPDCSQYPGLMISTNTAGVTFPFGSISESEGQVINWWYAIASDHTYFSSIEFEVSPFIPIGTEIDFSLQAVTMGCMDDSCFEDPYCHECPLTPSYTFSITIGDMFPNRIADANLDGDVDILDVIEVVNYILYTNQDIFDESNQLFLAMTDINQDYMINIQDVIQMINIILN